MTVIKILGSPSFFNQIIDLEQTNFQRDALSMQQLAEIVATPNHAIFMSCEADEISGFIYVHHIASDKLLHVMKLVVKEGYRRGGRAEHLLQYVEAWAKDNGVARIILEVRASNSAAFKLYEKCDYRVLGQRKNFYSFPREDAIVFEKKF
jgi:ribosomal-protein-alanine N-acetyltransferase